ncbi:MAG: GTPase HflX [Burkholderiaceae bacterium]
MRVALGPTIPDEQSLDELAALAESAGFVVVGRRTCRRQRPDPALYIGAGKADEIAAQLAAAEADLVLFDHELSAVQQRNLGERWGVPVLDRTELILDIFGRRARSHEGKLQVELARLEHLSARLVRGWTHLERQRGGIGVRGGPGEKQIELDRRQIGARVRRLRADLERIRGQRRNRRRSRDRNEAFKVSIVGYTNAGKSTLFNRLTGADAYAADQPFATLDTLTRRARLPSGDFMVLSDTVGFVRDLPHQLVDAFEATLEETAEADLLLHVVDASAPDRMDQIAQVERVLAEIGAGDIPVILVHNKIDRCGHEAGTSREGGCGRIGRVALSAATGDGIDGLLAAIAEHRAARRTSSSPGDPDAGRRPVTSGPDEFGMSDPRASR